MTAIIDIIGHEILDSRGNPTVEVDVVSKTAAAGAAVPLRAPDRRPRGGGTARRRQRATGKGVRKAVDVNGEIFDAIGGLDAEAQVKIDETLIALDGTPNKAARHQCHPRVSLAAAKVAAAAHQAAYRHVGGGGAALPVPMMNIVNGGAHADNPIDSRSLW